MPVIPSDRTIVVCGRTFCYLHARVNVWGYGHSKPTNQLNAPLVLLLMPEKISHFHCSFGLIQSVTSQRSVTAPACPDTDADVLTP